jgi:hypothetical protein
MTTKREVLRMYSFADSWLIELCNTKRQFILRDIAEFSAYSIDALVMDAFQGETNTFEAFETDEEFAGLQSEVTEAKDAAAEAVKTDVRSIMARIKSKHKPKTARYRRFGTKGMDDMDNSHLLTCGRRVARVATVVLAEYTGIGLTAAIITELETKCQTLEDKLDEQADAIADRDIATEDRIEMGNALFGKLSNYCSFGQQIWVETDEAKYNDYIIYTSEGKLVEPIAGTVEAEQTVNVMNKKFEATAQLKIKDTGSTEFMVCITTDALTACSAGITLNPGEEITVTVTELGDPETCEFLNITNLSASEQGSYEVTEL